MNENVITFEDSAKEQILSFFDKVLDKEGYIVEKDDISQRVITQEGEEIRLEDFAALKRGSEIFVKSDFISLIKLADNIE